MLIVVGIIAAIAVPNFLNAVDRGKQKRTMADLRAVAAAMEGYAVEHRAYPVAGDLETLRSQLVPAFIKALPALDGWGRPILVSSDETSFELVSTGKDGVASGCDGGATTNFSEDICLRDGEFTQWPEGVQH
jgi:general secretion pathway protein G